MAQNKYGIGELVYLGGVGKVDNISTNTKGEVVYNLYINGNYVVGVPESVLVEVEEQEKREVI